MSMEISNVYNDLASAYKSAKGAKEVQGADQILEQEKKSSKKSHLERLQEKYSGFDISKGTFSQNQILSAKRGCQGVQISSAYLAKAENDEKEAKKLDEMLSGVEDAQRWLENAFAKDGTELISNGYYIDDKGNMGSWSVVRKKDDMFSGLNNQANLNKDRVQEQRDKKAQEKKAEEKKAEKEEKAEKLEEQRKINNQPTVIVASSNKELLEKANDILGDDNKIATNEEKQVGSIVDVSL